MANHASALKAHRQSQTRKNRNRSNRSALRTALKGFIEQTKSANTETIDAQAAVSRLYSDIDKAAKKRALSKNAAARQKSRLAKRINEALAAAAKK